MEGITYLLSRNEVNSDLYYKEIKTFSKKVISYLLLSGDDYLIDFMQFIEEKKLERIRTREEYAIEFLLIGMIIHEYLDYGRAFKYSYESTFNILNILRKNENYKEKVDDLRGLLATDILMRRKKESKEADLQDLNLIIKWMKATGDFQEEIYRLDNFQQYFTGKDDEYIKQVLDFCLKNIVCLYGESKKVLGKYTSNVATYLDSYKKDHIGKEDIIYCGKREIHYFYNMVSSEVMNEVYKRDFLSCRKKHIFLPECMRQKEKKCASEFQEKGYICKECSENCNVAIINKYLKDKEIDVYVIPHETMLFQENNNESFGIIGIACVTNLVAGGWKAIRMGFKPQCVILDYSGCSKHWLKKSIMTSINFSQLENIFLGK